MAGISYEVARRREHRRPADGPEPPDTRRHRVLRRGVPHPRETRRQLGRVVGPVLVVYGIAKLLPLIPLGNNLSSVYAMTERPGISPRHADGYLLVRYALFVARVEENA